MGLSTDSIFIAAINADASLMSDLGSRLYSTAIPLPDEEADNVPLPYVIVKFDGLENDQSTKDCYESDIDRVHIGVEIAAKNRQQLSELAARIRRQIRSYFENVLDTDDDYDAIPLDYQFSADAVQFDPLKPCHWQTLHYLCDVRNDNDGTEEELL